MPSMRTLAPKDLQGKRIGVRSYTQTTGVWMRGILQNEYGVDPGSVALGDASRMPISPSSAIRRTSNARRRARS